MLGGVKKKIQLELGDYFRGCVEGVQHPYQLDGLSALFLRHVDPQLNADMAFSMQQRLLQDPILQEHMQDSAVVNRVGVPKVQFHQTNLPVRSFYPLSHFGSFYAATGLKYYTPTRNKEDLLLEGHDEAAECIGDWSAFSNLYAVALDIRSPFDEGTTAGHYIGDTIDSAERGGVLSQAQAALIRDMATWGSFIWHDDSQNNLRLARLIHEGAYKEADTDHEFSNLYYKDEPFSDELASSSLRTRLVRWAIRDLLRSLYVHQETAAIHPELEALPESARTVKNLWAHYFIDIMQQQGFDGIVYKNDLEDKGKKCWINFSADQIRFVRRPDFIPETQNDLDEQQRQVLLTRYLDPSFEHHTEFKNGGNSLTQGMPVKTVPLASLLSDDLQEAAEKFLGREACTAILAEVRHSMDEYRTHNADFFERADAIREQPDLLMQM